ncbi:MAG TPA: heat-inducible transcriptional repressor HrcA [Acidimicrobiales bacterium]|nr:heat-inducible transcriptional repressor HrcA [Acidimicrobiales bacterium]
MLEERKASILRAVVQEYITTAQPVGSSVIANAPGIEVSPATVRNEMVQLERQGYLHQPHTSAGRVPTEKGYRFFVNALGPDRELGAVQSDQVRAFFDHSHGELERLLHETAGLLSNLTSYAALVVSPGTRSAVVRSIQLVRVASRTALAVAILSNGAIEKGTIDLEETTTDADVEHASSSLARAFIGMPLDSPVVPDEMLGESVARLVETAAAVFNPVSDGDSDHVFVGGTARMAGAFDAVETVREVLSILEQQLVVVSLMRDVIDRGLTVAIGSETGVQPLAECALIVAPYEVDGDKVGTIGVLGPTRMNYPQALSAVAVVSQQLGDRLSEG